MISIIAAVSLNKVIGKNNKIPWHLAPDLADFKKITTGNTVIMGRKTFESIGKKLKNRKIIILSRQKNFQAKGAVIVHSRNEALKVTKGDKKVFIAGGGEIYKLFLNKADEIRMTKIYQEFEGEIFFPKISDKKWQISKEGKIKKDLESGISYSVNIYKKNENRL